MTHVILTRVILTRIILSLPMAQGATQTGRTCSLVITRRLQAAEAISIWSTGDCLRSQ